MKKILLASLILGISTAAGATDLTVTYKMKGGDGKEKTVYWSDQYQLTVNPDTKQDMLVDYAQSAVYTIDHSKKKITYFKMGEMAGMMGGMNQMISDSMNMKMPNGKGTMGENLQKGMDKFLGDAEKSQLQKLGQETIAGRTCDNYLVERKGKRMAMSEEVCIDPSLRPPGAVGPEAEQLGAAAEDMMSGAFSGVLSPGQKDLAKIEGLTLRRRTKIKKVTEEEATLVKEGPIDPAIFKLPDGYAMVNQMQELQQQMQGFQQQLGNMNNK